MGNQKSVAAVRVARYKSLLEKVIQLRTKTHMQHSHLVGWALLLVAAALAPETTLAHSQGHGVAGGFLSGFAHPVLGWDHVIAMVAVGLWGAFLGVPALWLLPIVFPLVMAVGAGLGILGVPLPAVEAGIAASGVVLGLLILLAAKFPLWLAIVIVGAFAIFHGYAHGAELPDATNPLPYVVGFVIATGLLHLMGIAFGLLVRWPAGVYAVRAVGAIIAVLGVAFLIGFA